jgi:hypothetical protein
MTAAAFETMTAGHPMTSAIPFRQRLSCTIPEACAATGLGRTKMYEEIGAGRIRTRKFGTRTLVVVDSLVALIGPDREDSAAPATDPCMSRAG